MNPPLELRRSPLDRLFSLFTVVRPGESIGILVMAVNVFLLLGSYYLLKTTREALILVEGGAEIKSYAAAGQALLLLLVVPAFGWLSARVGRIRLITTVNLFFVSNLLLFWILGKGGAREGIAFYLWLGVYNNFVVAQFWAFANDIYSEEQGKRLFPPIGIGMSLGAWFGARIAREMFHVLGPYNMMLAAALVLLVSIALTLLVDRMVTERSREQSVIARTPLGTEGAFSLIRGSRYLMLITLLIFLLNLANTSGEYLLDRLVVDQARQMEAGEAAQKNFVGEFKAGVFEWVNLVGFLVQTFLTARIIRWFGVGGSLFILPVIALGGYSAMLLAPVLSIVRVAKIAENSTDYSLQNTLRQALFLPASRDAKYKAKAAIDTFVVRFGDVSQAGLVLLGTHLAFSFQSFARIVVGVVVVWLCVAWALSREYRRQSARAEQAAPAA